MDTKYKMENDETEIIKRFSVEKTKTERNIGVDTGTKNDEESDTGVKTDKCEHRKKERWNKDSVDRKEMEVKETTKKCDKENTNYDGKNVTLSECLSKLKIIQTNSFITEKNNGIDTNKNCIEENNMPKNDSTEKQNLYETEKNECHNKTPSLQMETKDNKPEMPGSQNNEEKTKEYNRIKHMKDCIREIRHFMHEVKEETNIDCACNLEVPLDTLTDIFKHYGILCYCMVYHKKTMPFNQSIFYKSFLLEINILEYLYDKPITIPEVYITKKSGVDEKDKFIASYKTFFNETKIHINCEQDVESLSYKYYKHYYVKTPKFQCNFVDVILFVLFKRRESERFFTVFNNHNKTLVGLRISLLLSLFSECCKEVDEVLRIYARNRSAKDEGIFYDIKKGAADVEETETRKTTDSVHELESYNSSKSAASDKSITKNMLIDESVFSKFVEVFKVEVTDVSEDAWTKIMAKTQLDRDSALLLIRITTFIYNLIELEKDCNAWFRERQIKKTWEESVKKWAFSKHNGNCEMDNSMILHCSKYKKFEEGYLIFTMQSKKNERCMIKTCFLCLNAYRNTNDKIWIERICDLLRVTAIGKMESVYCTITDSILEGALGFTEEGREILLLNIISIFEKYQLEKQEHLIDVILRGFFALCTHCKDSKTCDLCYNYTLRLYNKWKESKQGFFFKRSSKLSDDIYSSILGVCDQSNHCDAFHKICRDILKSNDNVGSNVMCRLENYHKKCNCQKISYSMHPTDKSYCEVLLKHCMCEFKD